MYDDVCTLTVASLIGRAEEDSVLRDEFLKDLLMACTVLQSEDQGIFPDQLCILLEGPARDVGLCEEDDEIDRAFCCAARSSALLPIRMTSVFRESFPPKRRPIEPGPMTAVFIDSPPFEKVLC